MRNASLAQRFDSAAAISPRSQRQDENQFDADMPSINGFRSSPLMTREAFAQAIGLPIGVLRSQAERGYWPQITIGKRVFINVEAIRLLAAERAAEFTL